MERLWKVQESIVVNAPRTKVYAALSRLQNMGKWSPECFYVWHRGTTAREGTGFVGFNRKGPLVWFTTCRVTVADAPYEFAFRVSTFGLPVALWGYRLEPDGEGTRVTEYWQDLRSGPGARVTELLGLVFTGTRPEARAAANRAGMRTTLRRLQQALAAWPTDRPTERQRGS
ncbi:SRPBCC family protein [Streptomyces sp. NRRL F-5053]|uniref:SRPBCC family protein n=1 Tax=Streptomyces sp. NRRL F-5053 TaxID=1463854 RepID=UPI00056AA12D|nr:SRPBCC family protein [Streptomyces sp. NRRL F-5053]